MVPRMLAPSVRPKSSDERSRFDRAWTTVAVTASAVFVVLAILQSTPLPLLSLVLALSGVGGVPFVQSPIRSAQGRKEYVEGAAASACLVLVVVGIGHHPTLGLTTTAVLLGLSPWTLRRISGSRS